jgi:aminoglycoside 2''-phosphotransferase
LDVIHKAIPDLNIISSQLQDHGQNNLVLVINQDLIFRFPRYQSALDQMVKETTLLNRIQDYVTLPTPSPLYTHLEAPIGEAFSAYRRLQGEPLWCETFLRIQDEIVIGHLATDLAAFMRTLHQIPLSKVIDLNLPICDTQDHWITLYEQVKTQLFPKMRPDARFSTTEHFESFLAGDFLQHFEPVLKHGDFGSSNILFDQETRRVSGIIDFGGACLGDPAYDIAGLLSCFGEEFIGKCTRTYPEIEHYGERILFYSGTFALIEALSGLENGNEAAYQNAMALYI